MRILDLIFWTNYSTPWGIASVYLLPSRSGVPLSDYKLWVNDIARVHPTALWVWCSMKPLASYLGTWLLFPSEFEKWLAHSSVWIDREDLPKLDGRSSRELPLRLSLSRWSDLTMKESWNYIDSTIRIGMGLFLVTIFLWYRQQIRVSSSPWVCVPLLSSRIDNWRRSIWSTPTCFLVGLNDEYSRDY